MDLLVKKLLNISIYVLPIIDKHLIHLTIAVVSSWTSYNPNFLSVYLQNNKDFFFLMSSHLNSLHTKKKKNLGSFLNFNNYPYYSSQDCFHVYTQRTKAIPNSRKSTFAFLVYAVERDKGHLNFRTPNNSLDLRQLEKNTCLVLNIRQRELEHKCLQTCI